MIADMKFIKKSAP